MFRGHLSRRRLELQPGGIGRHGDGRGHRQAPLGLELASDGRPAREAPAAVSCTATQVVSPLIEWVA